jgi:putative glycosyltransferase (TIGR04372 family)
MNLKLHLKKKVKSLWARLYKSTNTKVDFVSNCKNIILLNKNILDSANTLSNQGRFQEAIILFEHALRNEPNKADICFKLGQCYSNVFQPEKSISFYTQAITLNPDWSVPYLYLALSQKNLALSQKNQKYFDDAIRNLNLSINLKPCPDAFCELGEIFSRLNKLEDAANAYEQAINVQPDHIKAFFCLKDILVRLDRKDEANDVFEKALILKPDDVENYENLCGALWVKSNTAELNSTAGKEAEFRAKFAHNHQLSDIKIRFVSPGIVKGVGPICYLDAYIKSIILGWAPTNNLVLLARVDQVVNLCLLSYWSRYIVIITDPLAIKRLSPISRCLEDMVNWGININGKFTYIESAIGQVQRQWELEGRAPLLNISDSDSNKGWQSLFDHGIPPGSWFVCLHVRDGNYWHEDTDSPESYRNANINSYISAIETITKKGGWVIRVGDSKTTALPEMDNFFDYACSSLKSDWMDVFLCSSCRFFLGTMSGLYLVPHTFGVPCVLTNWLPVTAMPRSKHDLFILKLLYSIRGDRLLSFEEGISADLAKCATKQDFENLEIKIIDNSPDDIKDLVLEMLNRLDGIQTFTESDIQLKNRFDKLFSAQSHYGMNGHIGLKFIRRYQNLLS